MADVRCPMCGKTNPAEAEVCQYCQARLKPLGFKPGSSAGTPPPAQPNSKPPAGGDETDWLRELMGSDSTPEPTNEGNEQPHPETGADDADWLERIRQRTQEEQDAISKIGPKPKVDAVQSHDADSAGTASELENWLKSLEDSEGTTPPPPASTPPAPPARVPPPAAPVQNASDDDDDWLRSLTARIEANKSMEDQMQTLRGSQETEPEPPAAEPADTGDLPAWMQDMRTGKASENVPSQTGAPQPPAEEPAGWLKDFGQVSEGSNEVSPDELPDWARNISDQKSSEAAPEAADADEIPDWLSALQAEPPAAEAPVEPAVPSGDLPDWLSGLREETPAAEAPVEPAVPSEDLPDWLSALQAEPPAAEAPVEPAAPSEDLPDWLSGLREEPPAAEAPVEPAALSEDLPDWLSAAENAQPAAQDSAGTEDLPDWMNAFKLEQPEAANPPPDQPEPAAPAEDLPDWMKGVQPVEETPAQPAEILPDWMSQITPPAEEAAVTSAEQGDQEVPDWLRDFQAAPAAETGPALAGETGIPTETAAPSIAQPEAETPDWLNNSVSHPAEAEAQPAAEVPDWLKDVGSLPADSTSPEAGAAEQSAAEAQPAAETPDWMNSIASHSADTDATPPAPAAEDQPASGTPDWLRDFGTLPGAEGEQASSAASVSSWLDNLDEHNVPAAQSGPSAMDEAAPAENIPDWLKAIKSGSQSEEEPGSSFGAQGLPEWMNNPQEIENKWQEPARPENAPTESVSPFASSEMDAMLAGVTPPENEAQPAALEGQAEALEPAQLPSWLQAMRPVESAVTDIPASLAVDDQRIEKSGPLAGLRGVLPGEELASNYHKPPVYTNKLQVSEKQHLHANLLENILANETRTQAVPGEARQASQTIMRLLVAVLLIFLVYVPALTGFNLPVPANLAASQPGVAEVFQSISELAPGSNILVAADFEAGLNGEITSAALPVLKYLQTRQPNVVIGSTVPSGPVLAEMLLSQASITPIASFGYIAGGTHALKMMGAHATTDQPAPLQQVIPFPYGQKWTDAGLQGIKDITGFQRILVLTDNLENARAWVEQVQPGLGPQTQILIISSAQVAPLVRTYMESGQVSGVVSGLAGGAAFEQLSQQSGPGSVSWTAYQLTMGAVILLIIAGALITGISSLLKLDKSKRKV